MKFVVIFILFAVCAQIYGQEKVISFCKNDDPPLIIDSKSYTPGSDILSRIMIRIFEKIDGYTPQLTIMPWQNCLSSIPRGVSDGTLLIYKSKEREKYFEFSIPLMRYKEAVFYNNGNYNGEKWSNIDDLLGLKMGALEGYHYHDDIMNRIRNNEIRSELVHTSLQNFRKLKNGRVDFIVGFLHSVNYFEKKLKIKNKINMAFINADDPNHMAFGKDSAAVLLLPEINKIIKQLQDSSEIDRITKDDY